MVVTYFIGGTSFFASLFQNLHKKVYTTNPSRDDLNELLKVSNLHKAIAKAKKGIVFSEQVQSLLEETAGYSKRRFSRLKGDQQRNRKTLNRLLLEETYPSLPKNIYIRRDDYDPDMYSKFTYIYYKLKDFEEGKKRKNGHALNQGSR